MKTCIVVLNYNNAQESLAFVKAIKEYAAFQQILLVDNHSTDDSYQILRAAFSQEEKIILLQAEKNLGYASGNNLGLRYGVEQVHAELLFLANPDVSFSEDVVTRLREFYQSQQNETLGTMAPVMLVPNRKQENSAWKLPTFADCLLATQVGLDKIASPARYVQGKHVLETGVSYIGNLGKKPLLLCDDIVWGIAGEDFNTNLEKAGMTTCRVPFNGEASISEIERVSEIGKENGSDLVIGLGGGKTIDAAKAISDKLGLPVAVVPTIASTDAPTSALSVIYSEDGTFEKYLFYKKNPELVLVDTAVIAKAPCRLLASGIADALATWVEGRSIIESNGTTMAGAAPTLAAEAIAEKCEATLFANAFQAMEACRAKVVTPALESVVEANTLLSGIGFESCGLAAAHAIHNGFTALHGEIHSLTHGEKVAYGTLTQLVLENKPKEMLDKFICFYQTLGLPTTLKELKLEHIGYQELLKVGELATQEGETIHQMSQDFSAEEVTDALFAVDAYVKSMQEAGEQPCVQHFFS